MKTSDEAATIKLKRRAEEDRLAADIIEECRVQLMLRFRFLDLALWRMDLSPMRVDSRYPLATDGGKVHYDPMRVIGRFQDSFEEAVRDYLHLVMHCIFRHPFNEERGNAEAWSLTCDIVVENAAMDLCGSRFASAEDKARRQALAEIRLVAGSLLPAKVYQVVKGLVQTPDGQNFHGMGRSTLNEWRALFERDDHGVWPVNNEGGGTFHDPDSDEEVSEDNDQPDFQSDSIQTNALDDGSSQAGGQEQGSSADAAEGASEPDEAEGAESGADEPPSEDAEESSDDGERSGDQRESDSGRDFDLQDEAREDERDWEEIAKQIEMSLETFAREWGEEAGSLLANLAFANRRRYDYDDFLRQFMAVSERLRINMDEFDYVYYTFGLDTYGNMPLIEPLEYKETQAIRDFVIAVDTSESVRGDLVKSFVEHTFSMLKSSEDSLREVDVHVIQCDSRVQSDLRIRDASDVDRMMEGFQVRGFGGTDFRPVFDYVEMLRRRGELADLKGLIYFTDGLGQFPEKAPDYDVAFVFVEDEGRDTAPVPPWAMKLVLTSDEVEKTTRDSEAARVRSGIQSANASKEGER